MENLDDIDDSSFDYDPLHDIHKHDGNMTGRCSLCSKISCAECLQNNCNFKSISLCYRCQTIFDACELNEGLRRILLILIDRLNK